MISGLKQGLRVCGQQGAEDDIWVLNRDFGCVGSRVLRMISGLKQGLRVCGQQGAEEDIWS